MYSAFEIPANRPILIPNCPSSVENMLLELKSDGCSVDKLTDLIDSDAALSSKLKQHMNGYHLPNSTRVFDTKSTILMLGTEKLISLIAFYSFQEIVESSSGEVSNYWLLAPRVAKSMLNINDDLHLIPIEQEHWLYGFGLLKDIGIPLMSLVHGRYLETQTNISIPYEEDRLSHINHARLGYQWAKTWKLPAFLSALILNHHDEVLTTETSKPSLMQRIYAVGYITQQLMAQYDHKCDHAEWGRASPLIAKLLAIEEPLLEDTVISLKDSID